MLRPRSTSEGGIPGRTARAQSPPSSDAGSEPGVARSFDGLADERTLVDRAREGDVSAQGAIFDFYWPKIVRYTYAHCGNQHDAEDIASEVFLRMVEAIGRFQWRENVPFTAWLFRIARNQVVTHYRRSGNVLPLVDDGVGDPVDDDDPQEAVEFQLEMDEVYRAAEKLPKLQQEVIRLRFAADLSLADTARILEKKENNIKQLQHKAIAKMRQLLDTERPEGMTNS
jgi:RNA polymerase sigma-70 factor, ECF subfamily